MKIKTSNSTIAFNTVGYIFLGLFSIFCLLPFLLILSGSFTSEASIHIDGYRLIPKEFSLDAYKSVFTMPQKIGKAYLVTIGVTITGALLGLFFISMAGYVLQRKDFKYRNKISFFIYFTTLFNGGLIPWYILIVKYLHWKNSYLALIVPGMIGAWYIILMKNFMKSVPDSIVESAKIDGANDFSIYIRLIMPLSIPGLATIGLFLALGYWNDWFMAMLYITSQERYPLQYFLYNILNSSEFLRSSVSKQISSLNFEVPTESFKMATAIIVTGPIVFLYPFIQKYFVKGLTVGAVKG